MVLPPLLAVSIGKYGQEDVGFPYLRVPVLQSVREGGDTQIDMQQKQRVNSASLCLVTSFGCRSQGRQLPGPGITLIAAYLCLNSSKGGVLTPPELGLRL